MYVYLYSLLEQYTSGIKVVFFVSAIHLKVLFDFVRKIFFQKEVKEITLHFCDIYTFR